MTALKRRQEVRLHHDAAARAVDQPRARPQQRQLARPRHALGLRRERDVEGDDVGLAQQRVEVRDQARAEVARARLGNVGIEDEQPRRVEAAQARGHARADLAEADDAERLAVQLGAIDRAVPLERLEPRVRLGNAAHEREQHADRVLRRRDDVAVRRVDDDDAAARARVHVDVVHADARAPDDLEPRRALEQTRRHRRRRPGDERLAVGERLRQRLGPGLHELAHVEAMLAQVGDALRRDGIDDDRAHVSPGWSSRRRRQSRCPLRSPTRRWPGRRRPRPCPRSCPSARPACGAARSR